MSGESPKRLVLDDLTDDTTVAIDTRGRLTEHLPCQSCGYDLYGLSVNGECTECGYSVAFSLGGYDLHCAPLDWLKRIDRGFRLLTWFYFEAFCAPLLLIAFIPLSFIIAEAFDTVSEKIFEFLCTVIAIGLIVLGMAGLFLATWPESRLSGMESWKSNRVRLRLCLLCIVLFTILVAITWRIAPSACQPLLKSLSIIVGFLAVLVVEFHFARYCAALSRRLGQKSSPGFKLRMFGCVGMAAGVLVLALNALLTRQPLLSGGFDVGIILLFLSVYYTVIVAWQEVRWIKRELTRCLAHHVTHSPFYGENAPAE